MSHYDDVLRCERARLEPDDDEPIVEPCECCGCTNYDYIFENREGEIVGCDNCVTKVRI